MLILLGTFVVASIFTGGITGFIVELSREPGKIVTTPFGDTSNKDFFWHFFEFITIVVSVIGTFVFRCDGEWPEALAGGLGMGFGMATGFLFGDYVPIFVPYWRGFAKTVLVVMAIASLPLGLLCFGAWEIEVECWERGGGDKSGKPMPLLL